MGLATIGVSQISNSTTAVLSRYALDGEDLPYSSNLNFLENKAGRIPIVESYEFRTEMNEFDFNQQEYLIRFDLNSSEERKAYDRVLESNRQLYNLKQDEYMSELLERDYKALVDYYFDMSELDLVTKNLSIVKDKQIVLSKLLSNSDKVDISDWLANQNDLVSLLADSVELERALIDTRLMFFGEIGRNQKINFDDLISIDNMKGVIERRLISGVNPLSLAKAEIEETKAKAEFALEEAETNKWLQYIQLRYQSDNDVSFQKELSFSSSINIPTKSTNKVKRNEAALEVWDKKYDRLLEEEKSERSFSSSIIKMESVIVQYNSLKSMIEAQELNETYENYLSMGNVSPMTLLEIKENILKYKLKLLDAQKSIYEVYLELISDSLLMVDEPRRNFLTNSLKSIK